MENPEQLTAWLFQQRDSFRRFFAAKRVGSGPHVTTLISNSKIVYTGHDELEDAYLRTSHWMKSSSILLHFTVEGVSKTLRIPAPRDDGMFVINGTQYTAPIQRLIWVSSGQRHEDEYRRIDHVLRDGWKRRSSEKCYGKHDPVTLKRQALKEGAQEYFDMLCAYLRCVLSPTSNSSKHPDALLYYHEAQSNWGDLAAQTLVSSLSVKRARRTFSEEDRAKIKALKAFRRAQKEKKHRKQFLGTRRYCSVSVSSKFGKHVRRSVPGTDVFHTPQSEKIGLTRYLAREVFVGDDRRLQEGSPGALGLLSSCVPFAQHDDGRRVLMACGMIAQAVPLVHACPPHCQTDFEKMVRGIPGLIDDLGVNLRVGFMFWEGLNYEDAIVVSRSAAEKLGIVERRRITIPVPCCCLIKSCGAQGLSVAKGDPLVELTYSPFNLKLRMPTGMPAEMRRKAGLFPEELDWQEATGRSPCDGVIEEITTVNLWDADSCPGATRYSKVLHFTIRISRPLEIGDKLANLHGNKGVVSAILPDDEMPKVEGEPLEVLLNPIGIINRGNYGQILEALASQTAIHDGDAGICEDPQKRVKSISGADGSFPLFSAVACQHGTRVSEIHAVVGLNYILRLPHYARASMNVNGDGIYSTITGQPPRGIGQAYGEMEIAALQAHGAHAILKELCGRSTQTSAAGEPFRQKALREWLFSLGYSIEKEGDRVVIVPADLRTLPSRQTDLCSGEAKTRRDPECNVDDRDNSMIPLAQIRRRLSSDPFFNDNEPVYIDLRNEYQFSYDDEKDRQIASFKGRYLPVIHPKYRPSPPLGGGLDKTTKRYLRVIGALRRNSTEDVKAALRTLYGRLVSLQKRKHGIIRRVGLSRRLSYSSRFVITPGPDLAIDQVSMPWDAVRKLYWKALNEQGVPDEVLNSPQSSAKEFIDKTLVSKINEILRKEWVLVNRAPTLHKYNVMTFHPSVHFDSYSLRIPLLACPPYQADHDGDQMSVVPLFDEGSKKEAVQLSFVKNVVSVANGAPVLRPTKDLLLGLFLVCQDAAASDALNAALRGRGGAELPANVHKEKEFAGWIEACKSHGDCDALDLPVALSLVTAHSLRALNDFTNQSCFGSFQTMLSFLDPLLSSLAAKRDKFEKEAPELISGLLPDTLRTWAEKSTEVEILGKLAVPKFGGYRRRLYYRIRSQQGNGLAFDGSMREALDAIGSITELAMQKALSAKSGSSPLDFDRFETYLEWAIANGEEREELCRKFGKSETEAMREFSADIGLPEPELERHIGVLRQQVQKDDHQVTLLRFLAKPFEESLPDISGPGCDPRIAILLA